MPVKPGDAKRLIQLTRALDFAAVTDHAETWAEGHICRNKGEFPGYESKACKLFRQGGEAGVRVFMRVNAQTFPKRKKEVCGENNRDCERADQIIWQQIIEAAQRAYDQSSDCRFTSFVGYEYTRAPNAQHMHRNMIFKNAEVPERAASFLTHPRSYQLLQSLEEECRQSIDACDVLSIPHNPNISGGNAFNPREVEGFDKKSRHAHFALRGSFERLMEIYQHKGNSECLNGVSDILGDVDELCDIEALRGFGWPDRAVDVSRYIPSFQKIITRECVGGNMDKKDNIYKGFCLSSRDFARGALLIGLQEAETTGTNPFEFGFIGSSDTHIAAAGATEETGWEGHIAYEIDLSGRLGSADLGRFNRLVSNPGGLAGIYAIENSRDALFQSMKRREAFGTSGTRIQPRFFAGNYEPGRCDQENWLERAYAEGTPMGSKLPAQSQAFSFLMQAQADPDSYPLEKLQLIKGWIDRDGNKHNKVIEVAATKKGADQLCMQLTDPDYDPKRPAYYYLRAVELPSPRWSSLQCENLQGDNRPTNCDNEMPEQIREMAWTSPIWFTPANQSPASMDRMP